MGVIKHRSLPLHRRLLRAIRRAVSRLVEFIWRVSRRPKVLIVTGNASLAKVSEVETRVRFLLEHLGLPLELHRAPRASTMAYVGNTAVVAVEAAAVPLSARRFLPWVSDLDYETNPSDGWTLMHLGVALSRSSVDRSVAAAHRRFNEHVRALRAQGPRPVYVFGTGPSLQLAGQRQFTDGITIVCNTIVRDAELWNHLAPSFLAAGDAIYHFGHTAHARAFRADALRRLKESDGRTLFTYPAQFDVIVRPEFRDVESLLVPIPYGEHTDITVDLTADFCLPELENVLTILLLPLACTMSHDVRLWGFDGRGPTDSGFWANSDRHAYPELMQSIRDAHPAFFAVKTPVGQEVEYVKHVHGDILDERLTEAERRGFTFEMLHRSWTPTLQKRQRESGLDAG